MCVHCLTCAQICPGVYQIVEFCCSCNGGGTGALGGKNITGNLTSTIVRH